jgi:L,D-peptidoglycan transpeptidase YkuD (ErfK/YbiS/YcfS/YnhG family)
VRKRVVAVTVAGALALVGALALGPSSPAGAVATTAGQVVTVSAPNATSTVATVEAWSRQPDGRYKRVAYFPAARIGSQGMGTTSEDLSRTPTGRYRLTQPFGIKPNPGVSTSYFQVDRNDVWTGSTGTVINQHRRWPAADRNHRSSQTICGADTATQPAVADEFFTCRKNAEPLPRTAPVPYGAGAL